MSENTSLTDWPGCQPRGGSTGPGSSPGDECSLNANYRPEVTRVVQGQVRGKIAAHGAPHADRPLSSQRFTEVDDELATKVSSPFGAAASD